jgi:hypothetical protein
VGYGAVMTRPDEATLSNQPEKAHGDALEDVVEARPDEGDDQRSGEAGGDGQD